MEIKTIKYRGAGNVREAGNGEGAGDRNNKESSEILST